MTIRNRRATVIETFFLLLPAVLFFVYAAAVPSVCVIWAGLLMISLLLRRPLTLSEQTVICVFSAALLLVGIGSRLFPPPGDKFSFLAELFHPEFMVPFLLYLAAMATMFRRPEPALGISASAVLVVLIFCSELQAFYAGICLQSEHLSSGSRRLLMLYPFTAGLSFAGTLMILRRFYGCGRNIRRSVFVLLSWGMIGVTAWCFLKTRGYWEEQLRKMENLLMQDDRSVRWQPALPGLFDFNEVSLGETLRPDLREHEAEIALQAIGRQAPGYLRGRGFSVYHYGGKWANGGNFGISLPCHPGRQMSFSNIFQLYPAENQALESWTILPEKIVSGDFVWYPDAAAEVEAAAEKAFRTENGTISVQKGSIHAGYTVWAPASGILTGALKDEPEPPVSMQKVPYEIAPVLRELCYAIDVLRPQPMQEQISKILHFFHTSFQYSLAPVPAIGDPVEHFLLRSRRGHCELFASAMTLLLRQCGIPARYVTGFICEEPHCCGRSFVARIGNAHAWVEAYDRAGRQWMRLDPTPPAPPIPVRELEPLLHCWEGISLYSSEILSAVRSGRLEEAASALMDAFCHMLQDRITWFAAAAAAAAFGLCFFIRRHFRNRINWQFSAVPERRPMIRQYRFFLWKMRLSGRIPWYSSPTVQEMLDRLTALPLKSPEKQTAVLQFLRHYREWRYRP